jgi:hypothetical protein
VAEIVRVARPGAVLLCSIPNNFCYMYQCKGPHPDHVNNWSYDGFIRFMEARGLKFREGLQKGYWIPAPVWLVRRSYRLPLPVRRERLATHFFYRFEVSA